MAATDIKISQMPAATTLVGDELVPIVQDGSNKSTTIAKIIEGLATEEWVTQAIADAGGNGGGKILVVTELPQTGESNTIYMIPNESSRTNDIYDEYVWLTEGSKWEFLGNKHVEVDLSDYYNKGDINGLLNNKVDKVSGKALSTNDYTNEDKAAVATISNKQDILVSGTNIKTINSQSLLGQGNIEITVEGGGITDAPSDSKTYGRKNAQWSEVVIPDTSDMLTKTEASNTYQVKGDYLTAVPDEYVTETELSAKSYATTTQLDAKLDTETYNSDKATFATKEELADKANTSDLSNYLQTSVAESTYAKKSEIPEEYTLPIATAEALGGIKVGAGLSINAETGVLNATGGGTADFVDWANITSKPETFKPEAHQHVTSDITDLQDKLDEKQPVGNYITVESADEKYATKESIPPIDSLATKEEIADMATKTWVGEQGYLTEHQDISTLATKQEVTEGLANKADKTELANKQDTLVSGTNIKTINGETILGSGDIEIEGESTAIVDHGTNDTTFELTPNVLHKWDEVASLTLTLGAETPNIVNEFMIQFTSGATATQLSLPETVKWLNTPEIAANMVYQVSIVNNLAVYGGWNNE